MPKETFELTKDEIAAIGPIYDRRDKDDIKTKREMLRFISSSPDGKYFNEICKKIGGSKSTVNQYLNELEQSGLVKTEPGFRSRSKTILVKYFKINEDHAGLLKKLDLI